MHICPFICVYGCYKIEDKLICSSVIFFSLIKVYLKYFPLPLQHFKCLYNIHYVDMWQFI